MSLYLDEAATTPVRRDVLEAMWPWLGPGYGNASSTHELGTAARRGLEEARAAVAGALGGRASEVTFTSGGTEGDNAAVKGIALAAPRGRHVITSGVEHPAVLESAAFLGRLGYAVDVLGVDGQGRVDVAEVAARLRPDTTLVSVQLANNEVGTIQPVARIAELTRAAGVPLHTDAVQAAGWLPLDVAALGVDALSLSGHKLGAPKGVGTLWTRRGLALEPLLHGGGQEGGRRSGTENVAAAVGLAHALAAAAAGALLPDDDPASNAAVAARRDAFVAAVLDGAPGASLTGPTADRLPGHASFVFAGTAGEAVLLELERLGVIVSSGSACAAGHTEPSPVLTAMGLPPDLAHTAVRFTWGRTRTAADLTTAAGATATAVAALARLR